MYEMSPWDKYTDREADRQTNRERETGQIDWFRERQKARINRHTDRQTNKQTNGKG